MRLLNVCINFPEGMHDLKAKRAHMQVACIEFIKSYPEHSGALARLCRNNTQFKFIKPKGVGK